jgi:cell division protein FtsB
LATLARRWVAVITIAVIGYAYYHPLRSWVETRSDLASRRAEVKQLAAQKRELQARLAASTSVDSLARQARMLGYVKPGEHLFIVKGIDAWKKAHTIAVDGK